MHGALHQRPIRENPNRKAALFATVAAIAHIATQYLDPAQKPVIAGADFAMA